ncbi:MAG: hypothetical protein WCO69_06080 [Candidatus Omnitrophota bacterium]
MRNAFVTPRRFFVLCALIISSAVSSTAFCQAYTGQVAFLEEYATRLYVRGDIDAAKKEFERIARLEPKNATAAKYLGLITQKSGQTATGAGTGFSRIDAAINDITSLKTNIARYETGTRDLEYLIRNLITENDALYAMLYTRSRELGELRAKFSGTVYAGPFDELMKSLPPDRVPQHLHQSNELLKLTREFPESAVNSQAEEVQLLVAQVAAGKQALAAGTKTDALNAAITDKRSILVEQQLALIDKRDNLAVLKDNLTKMNATLKDIDNYYQSIKADLSTKNFTDQKQFADLMNDYTVKIKECDALRARVDATDKTLAKPANVLITQNTSLTDLSAALTAKDREIADYKSLLAAKTMIIDKQNADLAFTGTSLDKAGSKLTAIENLLKQNDADLADLQAGVARMRVLVETKKPVLSPVPSPVPAAAAQTVNTTEMKDAAAQKDYQVQDLKTAITSYAAQLADAQVQLTDARAQITALKDENGALMNANGERAAFCGTLNARLTELAGKTSDKTNALLAEKETALSLSARLEKIEGQLTETRAGLAARDRELADTQTRLRAREADLSKFEAAALKTERELLDQKAENTAAPAENQILHETLAAKEAASKNTAQNLCLDIQEKDEQLKAMQQELSEKNTVIAEAGRQSKKLQEKLAIIEAKQDAIKGVIQKRDMEFLKMEAERDALVAQMQKLQPKP